MGYRVVTLAERDVTVPNFGEEFAEVCRRLESMSKRLQELLPDPSIGPEERLERLARIVPQSVVQSAQVRTARSKWEFLRRRLSELTPEMNGSSEEERLEALIRRIEEARPEVEGGLFAKLEAMGDDRISDIGR